MSRPRGLPALAIFLIALVLPGCSALEQDIREPEYRLERLELLELGVVEQRFRLTLLVDNPNRRALPVRALRYSLDVEGIPLAEGALEEGFTIPANTEHPVTLEFGTRLLQTMPRLLQHVGAGTVGYSLQGEVDYGRWIRGTRPFERRGRISLRDG